MIRSWSSSSTFNLLSHTQDELARTGMSSFQLRQGLATSSSRAGGMVIPIYPAGFSGLPYRLEKRKFQPYGLSASMSSPSIASLPHLQSGAKLSHHRQLSHSGLAQAATGPAPADARYPPRRVMSAHPRSRGPPTLSTGSAKPPTKPKYGAAFEAPVPTSAPVVTPSLKPRPASAAPISAAPNSSYYDMIRAAREAKSAFKARRAAEAPAASPQPRLGAATKAHHLPTHSPTSGTPRHRADKFTRLTNQWYSSTRS